MIRSLMMAASSGEPLPNDDVVWTSPKVDIRHAVDMTLNLTTSDDKASSASFDGNDVEDAAAHARPPFIPLLAILVLVLAALCAVMGLVYAYIYFTKMNGRQKKKTRRQSKLEPHSPHHHHHHQQQQHHHHKGDEKSPNNAGCGIVPREHSTHMFLFKKTHQHHNSFLK